MYEVIKFSYTDLYVRLAFYWDVDYDIYQSSKLPAVAGIQYIPIMFEVYSYKRTWMLIMYLVYVYSRCNKSQKMNIIFFIIEPTNFCTC